MRFVADILFFFFLVHCSKSQDSPGRRLANLDHSLPRGCRGNYESCTRRAYISVDSCYRTLYNDRGFSPCKRDSYYSRTRSRWLQLTEQTHRQLATCLRSRSARGGGFPSLDRSTVSSLAQRIPGVSCITRVAERLQSCTMLAVRTCPQFRSCLASSSVAKVDSWRRAYTQRQAQALLNCYSFNRG